MAQFIRASLPGLCNTNRHMFESRHVRLLMLVPFNLYSMSSFTYYSILFSSLHTAQVNKIMRLVELKIV